MKLVLLVTVIPPTVTVMIPETAPVGTSTTRVVAVAVDTVAVVPLNLTRLFGLVVLKFMPVIVTVVVIGPTPGENDVIVGAAAQPFCTRSDSARRKKKRVQCAACTKRAEVCLNMFKTSPEIFVTRS